MLPVIERPKTATEIINAHNEARLAETDAKLADVLREKDEILLNMLKEGLSVGVIHKITGFDESTIKKCQMELVQ